MRRLFIPGYYSGFSNNRMSLDIAVVLAYLTGRVLVPYRFRLPRRSPPDLKPGRWPEPMLVPHLFDIPVPWSDEYLLKSWISMEGKVQCAWQRIADAVFCFPATLTGHPQFQHFRNGRWFVYTFDEREEAASDVVITGETLGHYSHFFYLDEERRREVIKLMKRLRPKRPYAEAADRIATSLGPFNAVHIRRGDFVSIGFTPRARSISGQEVLANLASRLRRDDLLVICTDGSPHDEFFAPIQRYFREVVFLDRYLRENATIRELISQLPQYDEAVEILLTQLVASKAQVFIGTLFSTVTALIHRMRGFEGRNSSFLYCYNEFLSPLVRFERCEFLPVDEGPYTWNRIRYPLGPGYYSWFREWPEAYDATAPACGNDVLPPGTIELLASGAIVNGKTIRYVEDTDGLKMISHWTDPAESVAWNLQLPADGSYLVDIRYACPSKSSGSRYCVSIEGAGEFEGRVWSTGGWTALSPWMPLGQLRIPAGRSTLVLRAIEKASDAIMNLSAVRLMPAVSTCLGNAARRVPERSPT